MAETARAKDPLFGNKLAAALLTVLLLAVGLPVVVTTFAEIAEHGGAHHGEEGEGSLPEGLVYAPFDVSAIGSVAEGAGEDEVDLGTLLAAADVERGARAAAICSSCHSFDQGGPNGTGPNLWGVVGRQVASVSGYSYSGALQAAGGVWSYDRIDPYLENSQGYVPGTQMAQKIRKAEKRADILAYLGSLSDSPVPFPEPAAAPAEAEGGDEGDQAAGDPGAEGDEVAQRGSGETDTVEEQVGAEAADTMPTPAAQPGEAVNTDRAEVNDRGDDGMPGDESREGSDYRSTAEGEGGPAPATEADEAADQAEGDVDTSNEE